MKKIVIMMAVIVTVACKAKKVIISREEVATPEQVTAVQSRYPDATKEELLRGYEVYSGPCTKCHKTRDLTGFTEPKLLETIDRMAIRAKITTEEKQALTRFALGLRATRPSK